MAAAGGSKRPNPWKVVGAALAFLAFLAFMVTVGPGISERISEVKGTELDESFVEEPSPEEASLGDRAASDVTCREVEEDLETSWALSMTVVEDLELPASMNREDAGIEAEVAIFDACENADLNERPVDSDFKGSLRAKLVHRSKR